MLQYYGTSAAGTSFGLQDPSFGLWDPSSLPLIQWHVAEASDLTIVSGEVTTWSDRSGNGRSLTPGSLPGPSFDGAKLVFDGTQHLVGPNVTFPVPNTIFVATRLVDAPTLNEPLVVFSGPVGTARHQLSVTRINDMWNVYGGTGNFTAQADNAAHIHSFEYGAAGYHYVDGSLKGNALDTGGQDFGGLEIAATGTGDFPTKVEMQEVIVVDGSVASATRERVEGYLSHKWGIALPTAHPYYARAPMALPAATVTSTTMADYAPTLWVDTSDTLAVTEDAGTGNVTEVRDKAQGIVFQPRDVADYPITREGDYIRTMGFVSQQGTSYGGLDSITQHVSTEFTNDPSRVAIVAVYQQDAPQRGDIFRGKFGNGGFQDSLGIHLPWSDSNYYFDAGGRVNTTTGTAGTDYTGVVRLATGYAAPTGNALRIDGTDIATGAASSSLPTTGSAGLTLMKSSGLLGELVILGAPTAQRVRQAEGLLAHKWGLASQLPATHPYRHFSPALSYDSDGYEKWTVSTSYDSGVSYSSVLAQLSFEWAPGDEGVLIEKGGLGAGMLAYVYQDTLYWRAGGGSSGTTTDDNGTVTADMHAEVTHALTKAGTYTIQLHADGHAAGVEMRVTEPLADGSVGEGDDVIKRAYASGGFPVYAGQSGNKGLVAGTDDGGVGAFQSGEIENAAGWTSAQGAYTNTIHAARVHKTPAAQSFLSYINNTWTTDYVSPSYAWDFGDNTQGTGRTPSKVYPSGTYTAQCRTLLGTLLSLTVDTNNIANPTRTYATTQNAGTMFSSDIAVWMYFDARVDITHATGSEGLIFEKGATGAGLAIYVINNTLYAQCGDGSSYGHADQIVVTAPLTGGNYILEIEMDAAANYLNVWLNGALHSGSSSSGFVGGGSMEGLSGGNDGGVGVIGDAIAKTFDNTKTNSTYPGFSAISYNFTG